MVSNKIYFTPASAKKTLPLVKKIVSDILKEGEIIKSYQSEILSADSNDMAIQNSLHKIQNYTDELAEIGCYFKDWNFEVGLVDFPAIINDKEVLLCWKSDEETLLYYHPIEGGFASRKLIPEEYYLL
ncbi:MAG: DUF2203 domain-containing protein [Ignavibacteria bacterium]|nr:DUF2203 domain-containing protein [Ignavibacteria bacterium]